MAATMTAKKPITVAELRKILKDTKYKLPKKAKRKELYEAFMKY